MATRREKVLLEVESNLAPTFARDAAAAKLLERSIDDLDGTSVRASKSSDALGKPIEATGRKSGTASREIDRLSGRIRLLADTAAILGPALVPIGAVGIPAVTGLAAQFGAAALAGGTAVVAFQGVGQALEAVNKAALEPTAENLEAARIAMGRIGPEAQQFVRELRSMLPALQEVRNAAAAGLFPGLVDGLNELERVLPQVEQIVFRIGSALGDLLGDGAASLAGPRWATFLEFIETEVPSALTTLGRTVGNLAHGLAELWMAFTPLNNDFASWMLDASKAFDQWAQGLSQTDGFQEFVDYIRANGPLVADALGSIGNAVLQIVEAAAPLGGPVLQALTGVADAIAAIAGSDAGPAIMATVTALALLRRSTAAFEAVSATSWATAIKGADTFAGKMQAARGPMIRGGTAMAGLGLAASGLADNFALANTATGAMMGAIGGPWGALMGGAAGLVLDFAGSQETASANVRSLTGTLDEQTGAITSNTRAMVANALETEGVLRAAQEVGISLSLVTDAAMGNEAAMHQVALGYVGNINALGGLDDAARSTAQAHEESWSLINAAINGQSSDVAAAVDSGKRLAETMQGAAGSYRQGASAAEEFRNAVQRVNALLEKRSNLRDFEAAIDDFTKSLKENGRTLDINTAKGRANEAAMDNIVSTAVKVAEGMRGTNRVEFLQQARRDFVDATAKLLGGRDAARQMWERLADLNAAKAKPSIELDGWAVAVTNAQRVKSAIDQVRSKSVTITVHTQRTGGNGTDFVSGGVTRPIVPRSTTFNRPEVPEDPLYAAALGRVSASTTYAARGKGDSYNLPTVGAAAQQAASSLGALSDMSRNELRERRKELTERQRMLERELRQAQEKLDAERDYLREIRDARRSLAAETSGNFIASDLFGNFGTEGNTTFSSLLGTLGANGQAASNFENALQVLEAMGFDGGAFAELAASGNLAAAEAIIAAGVGGINAIETAYTYQQQQAQSVGQFAGVEVFGQMERAQLQETRAARREQQQANQHLKRVTDRLERVEKAIDKLPAPIGKEVGHAINGADTAGKRGRVLGG